MILLDATTSTRKGNTEKKIHHYRQQPYFVNRNSEIVEHPIEFVYVSSNANKIVFVLHKIFGFRQQNCGKLTTFKLNQAPFIHCGGCFNIKSGSRDEHIIYQAICRIL